MKKYIVAVSGGVDSVVLLDILARGGDKLVVAHVDHGIRGEESAGDARFVRGLAVQYQLPCVVRQLNLSPDASEEQARELRYQFLGELAEKYGATIVTAHHMDDLVETIALNLTRGTGWRGLAVLGRADVVRPLLALSKSQIYDYALAHRLEWVEDSTNASDRYLRNRLRHRLAGTLDQSARQALYDLRASQLVLRADIQKLSQKLVARSAGSRYFLQQIDPLVATELLGYEVEQLTGTRPLASQLQSALVAVKTARPGSTHQLGAGVEVKFTSRNYRLTVL